MNGWNGKFNSLKCKHYLIETVCMYLFMFYITFDSVVSHKSLPSSKKNYCLFRSVFDSILWCAAYFGFPIGCDQVTTNISKYTKKPLDPSKANQRAAHDNISKTFYFVGWKCQIFNNKSLEIATIISPLFLCWYPIQSFSTLPSSTRHGLSLILSFAEQR